MTVVIVIKAELHSADVRAVLQHLIHAPVAVSATGCVVVSLTIVLVQGDIR